MKRIFALIFVIVCTLGLVACADNNTPIDGSRPYFTGKVVEKYETTCLVEVTNIGNGNFFVGERLIVNTNIENRPDYELGDYLTIVFDGKVALSYPGQILNVYQISKTDSNGN